MNKIAEMEKALIDNKRNISSPCQNISKSILQMLNSTLLKDHQWLFRVLDSFGRPNAGILDGALVWPGNFYECLETVININGTVLNETVIDGTVINGKVLDGTVINGTVVNGTVINGAVINGTVIIGTVINGTVINGTVINEAVMNRRVISGTVIKSNGTMEKTQHCMIQIDTPIPEMTMKWGTCFPRKCSEDDIISLLQIAIDLNLLPVPALFKNSSVRAAKCKDSEPPRLDPIHIFYLTILGIILTFMIIGTLYDFVISNTDSNADFNHNKVTPISTAKTRPELKPFKKFLLCFSVLTNGRKILSLEVGKESVGCVNGIRFLSLTWVILCHAFDLYNRTWSNMLPVFKGLIKRVTFQPILEGTFSVDSFFVLSGLLMSYLFFKKLSAVVPPGKIPLQVLMMYIHRYLRLTPALALSIGFYVVVTPYLSEGPIDGPVKTVNGPIENSPRDSCRSWWAVLLYVNNFVTDSLSCMGWTWYLANDMQFFLVAPIFLYALKFKETVGYILIGICFMVCWITRGCLAFKYDAVATGLNLVDADVRRQMYIKPYTRIGSYLAGLLTGYLLYKHQTESKNLSKKLVTIFWIFFSAMGLAVIYGLFFYNANTLSASRAEEIIYVTFARSAWGFFVSWVIYACARGYGGPVDTFLSWRLFAPLSRINYCAYLFQQLTMGVVIDNFQTTIVYTDSLWVTLYLGMLLLIYGSAFLASLVFEAPFLGIEKLVFQRQKRIER